MKLVVGLGNPEPEYTNTRHNIGKDFLNYYLKTYKSVQSIFKHESKYKSGVLKMDNVVFVKPLVHMNDSGDCVSRLVNFYKINLNDLCIVYDELDLVIGRSKLSFGVGSKIHNGVCSIVEKLGSNKFWHLRIGIRDDKIPMSVQKFGYDPKTYVLAKFSLDDISKLKSHFSDKVNTILDSFLQKAP